MSKSNRTVKVCAALRLPKGKTQFCYKDPESNFGFEVVLTKAYMIGNALDMFLCYCYLCLFCAYS